MFNRVKRNASLKILLSFLCISFLGSLILCLPISNNNGKWFSFIDSFFTSVSAVCVTGLSVVDVSLQFSLFGQIILLLLIQIGGLGFITITSMLLLIFGKKITFERRLTIKEAFNQANVQGAVKLVKKILIFVFIVEFLGFLCFIPTFIPIYGFWIGLFNSLFMSISSFCNAGFDILGNRSDLFQSLSFFSSNKFVLIPIMLLIILGGLGFIVIFEIPKIFKRQKLSLYAKATIFLTIILIFGGAVAFALLEWNNPNTLGSMSTSNKILNAFFLSISPRTAGFYTFDLTKLSNGSIVLNIMLMFIGGGSASTAGGIKITTFFILLLLIFKKQTINGDIVFCKKQIKFTTIKKAVKIFNFYIFLASISTFLLCCIEGISLQYSIFEVVSSLSTVGLSLGITPTLKIFSKILITILMLAGRIGTLTLVFAILRIKDDKYGNKIEYTDSKIIVG